MKRAVCPVALAFICLSIVAEAWATDGGVVKWQQRPDMTQGANIVSIPETVPPDTPVTVADDWLCLDGSPVSGLIFWGSYPGWKEQEPDPSGPAPGVEKFRIQIYSDAPATPSGGFSRPDRLLYEVWTGDFTETYVASIWLGEMYEHKYRYDLDLPRIFRQERSKVYWLNIAAVPRDPAIRWGWESSMDRWNDFAVEGFYEDENNWGWEVIKHPRLDQAVDMSFELTTREGPIKWLQLPDMAAGRNIVSLVETQVVADDWLCKEGKPITEVHFWGSYLDRTGREHWEQENSGPPANLLPPTPGVETFKLSFHQDVPAGSDPEMVWSHPGELIREVRVEFNEVSEHYWDSVPHTDVTGHIWWEHKFYYIVKLKEPFAQEAGKVYWLDIAASPAAGSNWGWGWETSKDHWNDNAVAGGGSQWVDLGRVGSDFEDLPPDATYNVGDTFVTSDVSITVGIFQWSNGNWTSAGHARVVTGGNAGGLGNEINVNNVNLAFDFGAPITSLSLAFGEYGGNLNIEINHVFKNFGNFAEIDGQTIGGVNVTVVNGLGNDKGKLELAGTISQLALGGQELFIDDVKADRPTDMAFGFSVPETKKQAMPWILLLLLDD